MERYINRSWLIKCKECDCISIHIITPEEVETILECTMSYDTAEIYCPRCDKIERHSIIRDNNPISKTDKHQFKRGLRAKSGVIEWESFNKEETNMITFNHFMASLNYAKDELKDLDINESKAKAIIFKLIDMIIYVNMDLRKQEMEEELKKFAEVKTFNVGEKVEFKIVPKHNDEIVKK